jgi:hypothetical protein
MARAASVVNEFKKLNLGKDFVLLPLSAGAPSDLAQMRSSGLLVRIPTPRRRRYGPNAIPNSIATMRLRLVAALVKTLPRCPRCAAPIAGRSRYRNL